MFWEDGTFHQPLAYSMGLDAYLLNHFVVPLPDCIISFHIEMLKLLFFSVSANVNLSTTCLET